MREASALAPFHKALRKRLLGSVVVKHRDASMIGLVDTSITWQGRTIWAEGKLYNLPHSGDPGYEHWLRIAQEDSPTQAEFAKKLNKTSCCVYVIFIKKTCVYIGWPDTGGQPGPHVCVRVKNTSQAVERIFIMFDNWQKNPHLPRPSLFTS
jgi:hypothetical protein